LEATRSGRMFPLPVREADLSGADLSLSHHGMHLLGGIALARADLSFANLSRANLFFAHLAGANLSNANLSHANLNMVDLAQADLSGADLSDAHLSSANLRGATLFEANLERANLTSAKLPQAMLSKANLAGANLWGADLSDADMRQANLTATVLVETDFTRAVLSGSYVFGASTWDVRLEGAEQEALVITSPDQPAVTVDHLDVAQFIYLLLSNKKIRGVIEQITSKVVLILGRFTPERKPILDALRVVLESRGYTPVLFDFEKPASRDITETISILAGMARFVIADITDARSIPQELMAIVPNYPSVPVQPILLSSQREYGMFEHFRRFSWVLPVVLYETPHQLLGNIDAWVVAPAEARAKAART